jgi:hypothetical protein
MDSPRLYWYGTKMERYVHMTEENIVPLAFTLELELAYALNALWDSYAERCPCFATCTNPSCVMKRKSVTK